jgi:hypothetical protein
MGNFKGASVAQQDFVQNPDLNDVSKLMNEVWPRPCREYSRDMLAAYLCRPSGDLELSLGLYSGDRLVGYLAGVPYQVHYQGQFQPLVLNSFWTTSKGFYSPTIAVALAKKHREIRLGKGYDATVTLIETGSRSDIVFAKTAKMLGLSRHLLMSFRYLMSTPRFVRRRLPELLDPRVRVYARHMRDECTDLLSKLSEGIELGIVLQAEDMDFVLHGRPNTLTWVFRDKGKIRALINVLRINIVHKQVAPYAFFEHIVLGDLDSDECIKFIATVFMDSFWDEVQGMYLAPTGYFDEELFCKLGFYSTPTAFNIYYSCGNDGLPSREVKSLHLHLF